MILWGSLHLLAGLGFILWSMSDSEPPKWRFQELDPALMFINIHDRNIKAVAGLVNFVVGIVIIAIEVL